MAKTAACHVAGERRIVETKSPVPRAILVGVQLPGIDDLAHAASMEELGRLVNTLGTRSSARYRRSVTRSTAQQLWARGGLRNSRR
jgi:hypothetical protein